MNFKKPQIYKFDPTTMMCKYGVVVFVGRTKSGKSFCMKDQLYYRRKDYDIVIVISGSKETAIEFEKHVPALFIYNDLDVEKIKEIYEKQEEAVARQMRGYGKAPSVLIVIDDMAYKKKNVYASETFSRIFFNCRHARIALYISVQDCKILTPSLRQQTRFVFLAQEKNPQNRKRIYDSFNPCFKTFEEFDEVMKMCTQNFEQLVLDNQQTGSYEIGDNVFYYKASDHGNFKVRRGSKIWKHNQKHLDTKHDLRSKQKKETRKSKITKSAETLFPI